MVANFTHLECHLFLVQLTKHVYLIKLEVEDGSRHKLDGGTRHRQEMWRILVFLLKQPLHENDFGHSEKVNN